MSTAIEEFNHRFGDAMRTAMKNHLRTILQNKFSGDLNQGRFTLQLSRTPTDEQFDLLKKRISDHVEKMEASLPCDTEHEAAWEVIQLVFTQVVGPLLVDVVDRLRMSTSDMLASDDAGARLIMVGVFE
ncbi:hypothetical protein PG994_014526 [Apiospora phragmitis]|uniref:Uncharacterized protein n=1 Tax=Apiospora phragmitis TaxID=2905665 RepID=A0ABR1T4M2_9PEZI